MVLASDFKSVDEGLFKSAVNSFIPSHVLIPYEQDDEILVQEGEYVSEGQKIIKGKQFSSHSPIPGVVEEFTNINSEDKNQMAIKIKFGGKFNFTGRKLIESSWDRLDDQTLKYMFREKGVVNTFDGAEDLSKQIDLHVKKSAKLLFVRLFDDDPNRLIESFLAEKLFDKIIIGAAIIVKAAKLKGIVYCFDSKRLPQEFDNSINESFVKIVNVAIDTHKYPSSFKHDLVKHCKDNFSNTVFAQAGCNDLFIDVHTAINVYDAVVLNKPVIEKYIHVTGDSINAAAIMNVRIGTSYRDLALQCGGFKRKVSNVLINGVLTGFVENDLDKPITKEVKSVEFVPKGHGKPCTEPCIRCGNCRNICPVKIYPDLLYRSYLHKDFNGSLGKNVDEMAILCSQCQLCNSVCPSRLPISQTIELLKESLNEQE